MSRNGHTRRTILKATGAAGVVGTSSIAGCLGGGGGGGPLTIGMCNSLTGSLSTFGQRNKRGREVALADVNEVGVRGSELEILEEDTKSKSQDGVSAAQKLVNQNDVPLLIGAVGSGVSLSIYQSVIKGSNVVQISQNSTSPQLSEFPDLLRMAPPGRSQASALADLVSEDGHDSVALAYINNAFGQGIANAFKEAYDGETPYFEAHDQGKSSYSNVVTSMADSGAEAWVFVTYQPEFATMAQEAFDKGYTDVAVYGADSAKGPDVLDQAPEEFLEGMKVVVPSAAISRDNYKQFASTFQDEYGKTPTSWAAYTYDAVVTAAIAIQAAEEFSADAIDTSLVRNVTRPEGQNVRSYKAAHDILADGGGASDVNYQGVSGPIDLDENGDPVAFLRIFTVKDGAYEPTGFTRGG